MDKWIPTPAFDEAAEWFRSYRETEEFQVNEVYYKASLRAVLTAALSPERLASNSVKQWLLDLVDDELGLDELSLSEDDRRLVEAWDYKLSWTNLNGYKWATPTFTAFRAWIEWSEPDELREVLGDLLRGPDTPPQRIDAFCRQLSARYKVLHAEGHMRTKRAPNASLGFAATILGIVEPDAATLWRSGEYTRAAAEFGLTPPGTGTNADRYAASIAMQSHLRDGLRAHDVPVRNLLDVHDFIWVWSERQKPAPGSEERWWLFQATPDRYDIDGALAALHQIPWSVSRYREQIHVGHRVFLYRAGAAAAIVAMATVTSEPGVIAPEDMTDRAFDLSGELDARRQQAVWLDVDLVVDTPLTRQWMLADDHLKDMLNLRQGAGTNFPVEPAQARRLLELLNPDDPTFEEAWTELLGWAKSHEHFSTLARGLWITRLEANDKGIWYTVGGPNSPRLVLSRAAAERAWNAIRTTGSSGVGHVPVMAKGLLGRMPNIEFDLRPLRLVWASPKSHPVGSIKRVGMPWEIPVPKPVSTSVTGHVSELLHRAVEAAGLAFDPEIVDSIYMALRAKPFLIITGLSGTGKTKVALALQELLCDEGADAFISVRPDWIDARGLLGYHNLLTDEFVTSELTRLLIHADQELEERGAETSPHILILDEMNLARVEHYFSDYLSVLESRTPGNDGVPIRLHSNRLALQAAGDPELQVPSEIRLAPNVYIIGTVNIDETTHPFSRKVLDRANVVELFDVDLERKPVDEPVELAPEDAARVRRHFTRGGSFVGADAPNYDSDWLKELVRVNKVLERDRLHFGYRVRNEILAFVEQAGDEDLLGSGAAAANAAFDLQLLQKVLPKLAGSKERLARPLTGLLALCIEPNGADVARAARLASNPEALYAILMGDPEVQQPTGDGWPLGPSEMRFPRTARKIARMLRGLQDEGYTSFFE